MACQLVGPPDIVAGFPSILTVGIRIFSSEMNEMVTRSPTFALDESGLFDEIDTEVRDGSVLS